MRIGLGIALASVIVVAVAAYAVGASKSSQDVVLCAAKKGGDLSLASGRGKCGKGEKKLTIAKQGPAGARGPAGSPGADAPSSLEAVHFVTGPANDECFAKPGTFCQEGNDYEEWANYSTDSGSVGYYKDPSGVVHLSGVATLVVHGGEPGGFTPEGPFFLPPEYRPSVVRIFAVPAQKLQAQEFSLSATIVVRPNGAVALKTPQEVLQVSLDGISFRLP